MTLREEKPDSAYLLRATSACHNSTDRVVPCEGKGGCNREKTGDFRRECGDDGAFNAHQLELHPLCVSTSNVFERQDSLAHAATLQECDRTRDPDGILDFLETTMNIEDYLEDIHVVDMTADDLELDDFELRKCNTLYKGDQMQTCGVNDVFSHSDGIQEYLLSKALMVKSSEVKPATPEIKIEPDWGSDGPSTSSTHVTNRERENTKASETYVPMTAPRKYRLKTPQERNNTSYKVKRQRNNDAVRKSRTKAKQLQLMKDKQLEEALLEVSQLKEKLRVVNERLLHCRCRK